MNDPPAVVTSTRSAYRRILSQRRARSVFLADVLSKFGDWFAFLAGNVVLLDQGGLPAIAVFNAARFVVPIVVTPFAGRVGMRWSPTRVMVGSDVVRSVVYLALALEAGTGSPVWITITTWTIAFASGSAFVPAEKRLYRALVDSDDLAALHAVGSIVSSSALIVAPLVGSLVFAVIGATALLALDSVSFLASAVLLAQVRLDPAQAAADVDGERDGPGVGTTARFILRGQNRILAALGLLVGNAFLAGTTFALLVPVTRRVAGGDWAPGLFVSCLGLGTILGAFVGGVIANRLNDGRALVSLLVAAVATSVLSAVGSLVLLLCLAVILGFVVNAADPYLWATLQTRIPNEQAGPAWGIVDGAFTAALVGGSALAGAVGATLDLSIAPLCGAAMAVSLSTLSIAATSRAESTVLRS